MKIKKFLGEYKFNFTVFVGLYFSSGTQTMKNMKNTGTQTKITEDKKYCQKPTIKVGRFGYAIINLHLQNDELTRDLNG